MLLTVTAKPVTFPKVHTIAWTIDTAHISRTRVDTISFFFRDSGAHTVTAVYIDSTGSRRDSTATTIYIKDSTHKPINPNDTTSHDFVWSEHTNVNGENNMTGCWVFAPNDIWTVNGDLHHFDGSSWTRIVVHDDHNNSYEFGLSGYSIFGFADGDFWMTGSSGVLHYVGNGLAHAYSTYYMNHAMVHSAWGTSSNDIFFVGDSGLIAHFDGTNWTKMVSGTTKQLNSISGTSDHDIWADGFNPVTAESVLLHYDGGSWSEVNVRSIGNIGTGADAMGSVWVCDSSTHSIVYTGGSHVWHKSGNLSWVSDSGKVTNSVGGGQFLGVFNIQGNNANDIMVAADGGFISHWNGRSWNRYDTAFNPGDIQLVTNGLSFNKNTACVVGKKDGTSWVLVGQRK